MNEKKKRLAGWAGVAITLLISGFWAYWGAFENFHEGWYSDSLLENLLMFVLQYLIFAIVFMFLALFSIRWKKAGLILYILAGVACMWFFSGAVFSMLGLFILLPFIILALLYFFGEPTPKKWACRLVVAVPLTIILVISIHQGIKVSHRQNDGDFGMRIVEGNGITLAWAPRGPGWPDTGTSWEEAQRICGYLSEDGTILMNEAQNIWRLPTAEEAVRSMMLHGKNSGGVWNREKASAVYRTAPDKETPLWDVHSKVIYYWTSETSKKDDRQAYMIVYNGGVFDRNKTGAQDYISFRAVKEVVGTYD